MKSVVYAAALAALVCMSGGAQAAQIRIVEGTEVPIRFDELVSSKTNTEGDRFSISIADEIKLSDGTVIPAGYRGVGEVTSAEKRGMMGKAGTLNVRFDYVKIGESRLRLRGSKGKEGDSKVGSTIVLTILFGPLGLLKKGKDVEVKQGQEMTAFADEDLQIEAPLPPPPPGKG